MTTSPAETSTGVFIVAAAQVQAQADALNAIVRLAQDVLRRWWAGLDHGDAYGVRASMEEFLPALVTEFGEQAALLAAEVYDERRTESVATQPFTAPLADPLPDGQVQARGRHAIGPLFGEPDPDAALALLEQAVDKSVKQVARETTAQATDRDPDDARWARVPVGVTCAFCLVLASRGPVYLSEATASGAGSDMGAYHPDCDCQAVPIWSDADLPEGYDPAELQQRYVQARSRAKSGDLPTILAAMREHDPGVSDRHVG